MGEDPYAGPEKQPPGLASPAPVSFVYLNDYHLKLLGGKGIPWIFSSTEKNMKGMDDLYQSLYSLRLAGNSCLHYISYVLCIHNLFQPVHLACKNLLLHASA